MSTLTVDPPATVRRGELETELTGALGSGTEARWVLEDVLGSPLPGPSAPVAPDDATRARALVARRVAGEPLQYVLGHWAFRSLDLLVDRRVLIPRPETEQVVEVALRELDERVGARREAIAVDLGTGSGAIALSLAVEARVERIVVWATDASDEALEVAAANRQRLGTRHADAAERIRLRRGPWWDALPGELSGRVDLVVANPPYVAEHEWLELPPEVRTEPGTALVAAAGSDGTPGLAALEAVLAGAPPWLSPGGVVVVELAPHQAEAAAAAARRAGLRAVNVLPDLAGRPRVLVAARR